MSPPTPAVPRAACPEPTPALAPAGDGTTAVRHPERSLRRTK
ncbi:hypothetical protein [Streptomyces sp. NPDC089919]